MFDDNKDIKRVADTYSKMISESTGTIPFEIKPGSQTGTCAACQQQDKVAKVVAKGKTALLCQDCIDGVHENGGGKFTQDEFGSIFTGVAETTTEQPPFMPGEPSSI